MASEMQLTLVAGLLRRGRGPGLVRDAVAVDVHRPEHLGGAADPLAAEPLRGRSAFSAGGRRLLDDLSGCVLPPLRV